MKRLITCVLSVLTACGVAPAPSPDTGPMPSFDAPVGAVCDETEASLCAGGLAACVDSVCRPWCGEPSTCADDADKHYFTRDGSMLCVCVPVGTRNRAP